ncbi:MAG: hypothetical protein AAF399_24080, partial [Bacteroidota bacterium]
MNSCCDTPHPLVRDGQSQARRQVHALPPEQIPVDERQLADFLVFAHRFARQIQYYNLHNQVEGDWQIFFHRSPPIQLALISKASPEQFKLAFEEGLLNLPEEPFQLLTEEAQVLIQPLLEMLRDLEDWYYALPNAHLLKRTLRGLIQTHLRQALQTLLSLEAAFEPGVSADWQEIWEVPATEPDTRLLTSQSPAEVAVILQPLYQIIHRSYRQIVQAAPNLLTQTISEQSDHQPHFSLFLAFLRLMDHARSDLNRMTQRHLDHYYQSILGLQTKPTEPNQVHVVLELARQVDQHKVEAGTVFLAGKDANGQDVLYRNPEEVVVNKAQVVDMKGVFVNRLEKNEAIAGQPPISGVHTSPIAPSEDGQGAEFPKTKAVKSWQPFGNTERPQAKLGFAIADPVLQMAEGKRTVSFRFEVEGVHPKLTLALLKDVFVVSFSGEEDWLYAHPEEVKLVAVSVNTLEIQAVLRADQPAVVGFHPGLAGAKLATTLPVARLLLNP